MQELKSKDGKCILLSYKTAVAGWDDMGAFRTDKHYSSTTTRHINKYLGGKDIGRVVPQTEINCKTFEMVSSIHSDES